MDKFFSSLAQEGKQYIILAEAIPVHSGMVKEKLFLPTLITLENGNYSTVPDQWKEEPYIQRIHVLSYKIPKMYSVYRACVLSSCPIDLARQLVLYWGDNIGQTAAEALVPESMRYTWRYRE